MKRIISIILVVLVLFTLAVPAMAEETTIQPRWTYLDSVSASLEINWLGVASCSGRAAIYSKAPVKVVVKLQQLKETGWETIQVWSSTGNTTALASGQYAVARGYTYRVTVAAYVYDDNGNIVETGTSSKSCVF